MSPVLHIQLLGCFRLRYGDAELVDIALPRPQGVPFSERELACLSFVRWLCQTGRLDPREQDNV